MLRGVVLIFGVFVSSCTSYFDDKLVQVGDSVIRESEVETLISLHKYLNEKLTSEASLKKLIETELNLQILKKYGMEVNEDYVEKHPEELQQASRLSLDKVQQIRAFVGERDFVRYFAIPRLATHLLYQKIYLSRQDLHHQSFTEVRKFRHQIEQNRLKSFALKHGKTVFNLRIDRDNIIHWKKVFPGKRRKPVLTKGSSVESLLWKSRASELPMGRIAGKTYDMGPSWALVKKIPNVEREDHLHAVVVFFSKVPFKKWLAKLHGQITVVDLQKKEFKEN
ncbi:MAG: hypothetical protein KDD61_08745 [Bdellovibrionales bacterium]|nr:hypothetical protein [Bdellovibrionales bacterium]